MLKYPLEDKDISQYQICPFPDRPEVVLNHLENVVTKIKVDFESNFLDTRTGKPYIVNFKGNRDAYAIKGDEIEQDVPVIFIYGPKIRSRWREKAAVPFVVTDPDINLTRIYAYLTVAIISFDIHYWAVDLENVTTDLIHFAHMYGDLVVDGDALQVVFENEPSELTNYGDFTNYRSGLFSIRVEPVKIWNFYNYEETEEITDVVLSTYIKDFPNPILQMNI